MRRRLILCACCLWGIVADVWAQPNVSLQQLLQSPDFCEIGEGWPNNCGV